MLGVSFLLPTFVFISPFNSFYIHFSSSCASNSSPSQQQLSSGSVLLDNVFGRPWNIECENIRLQSPYRNIKGWRLASFIIKAGEDIRREALVMQCMTKLWTWFQEEIPPHLRPFLRPYTIRCIGGDAGIVECLPDVKSINEVKKETDGFTTLRDFFVRAYGTPVQAPFRLDRQQPSTPNSVGAVSFEKARDNFLRSLVGYSVVCYILQIKDRHNANILLDREGHIMVS
jgi:phosphatidylinositol kinase/protein kinase (PI-3  family)